MQRPALVGLGAQHVNAGDKLIRSVQIGIETPSTIRDRVANPGLVGVFGQGHSRDIRYRGFLTCLTARKANIELGDGNEQPKQSEYPLRRTAPVGYLKSSNCLAKSDVQSNGLESYAMVRPDVERDAVPHDNFASRKTAIQGFQSGLKQRMYTLDLRTDKLMHQLLRLRRIRLAMHPRSRDLELTGNRGHRLAGYHSFSDGEPRSGAAFTDARRSAAPFRSSRVEGRCRVLLFCYSLHNHPVGKERKSVNQ